MDEELQQLEAELQRLRPAALSPEFHARLESKLTSGPRRAKAQIVRLAWIALPIAAVIAVALTLSRPSRDREQTTTKSIAAAISAVPAKSAPLFKPVAAENVLLASSDDGLVTLADGTPARRLRESYVDTITWKNPRSNASLTWTVPREEVRVVPVSFQ